MFLLFLTLLPLGLNAQISLPYSCSFDTQADFNTFTLQNTGNGSRNWVYSSGKADYYGSATNANVWLISPSISYETGKSYKVTVTTWISRSSSATNLKVTVGQGATAENQTKELYNKSIQVTSSSNTVTLLFSVDQTGSGNFAFNCYGSITGSYDIYIDDITLTEIPSTPSKISGFTVIPDADEVLSAAVNWLNPSTNIAGGTLASLTKVELYRNNAVIYTNNTPTIGDSENYTDNVESAGKYLYFVKTYNEEGEGAASDTITKWIGPKQITLPYTSSFIDALNDFDLYTIVDANSDSKTWARNLKSSIYSIAYTPTSKPNDWLFTPSFVGEKGTYKLTFSWMTYNGRYSESMDITLGNSYDPSNHTTILNPGAAIFSSGLYNTKEIEFEIANENNDKYCIGFHLYSPDPWGMYLKDFHIEKTSSTVSISKENEDRGLIYDNASDILILDKETTTLTVYNLSGAVVLKKENPDKEISLNILPKGIYVGKRIDLSGKSSTIKLIKK
ncbi:MAG: T9SS type A sorting domain-containing protein [Dysgonomonas sp.]